VATDIKAQMQAYLSHFLRQDEPLVAFERVSIGNASGAPPMIPTNPFGWVGLTAARLIVCYEGSRSVHSDRLASLSRLELKSGMRKTRLIWAGELAFDGSAAQVSKEFAKTAAPLVTDRSRWRPVRDETTTCAVRVAPVEDPNLLAVSRELRIPTENEMAYCTACGMVCGLMESGTITATECSGCLRRIVGTFQRH